MDARRRVLLVAAGISALASALARSQSTAKGVRLGVLATSVKSTQHLLSAFLDRLRELGYVEGRNLTVDYRYSEGKSERFAPLVAELLASKPDLLVVSTDPMALAAKSLTSSVPIVFMLGFDPVGIGVVSSLAKPGANITGIGVFAYQLIAKRLSLLKEVVPSLARAGALYRDVDRTVLPQLEELDRQGKKLRVEISRFVLRSADDLEGAFSAISKAGVGAVLSMPDATLFQHRQRISELALKHRIPSSFAASEYVDAGGLMSYAPNLAAQFRHGATLVDKILKGANPGEIPVEQVTTFELVINIRTAKALGVKIPDAVRVAATRVVG